MSYYIYSTLTCDNLYTIYASNGAESQLAAAKVLIKGGSNVADKRFVTPLGVVTSVTDEELAILEQCNDFKLHRDNGFIVVEKKKFEPEVVAANMILKDKSAPATPEDSDSENENEVQPVVGKKKTAKK